MLRFGKYGLYAFLGFVFLAENEYGKREGFHTPFEEKRRTLQIKTGEE
jgi:hypothetical protein